MKFEFILKKETYCWTLGGLIVGTLKCYVNKEAKTTFYVQNNKLIIEIYSENPEEDLKKAIDTAFKILDAIKVEDNNLKEQKTTYSEK
jgi:hypothetical protein